MNSKVVLGLALLMAALVLSSEVAARELSETTVDVKSGESSYETEDHHGGEWGGHHDHDGHGGGWGGHHEHDGHEGGWGGHHDGHHGGGWGGGHGGHGDNN